MRIRIGHEALEAARALDVHLPFGEFECHPDAAVTAPCNINAGFAFASAARFGAFSYCGSFVSAYVASVGRYTSIAHGSSFGEGEHPVHWLGSSSCFYAAEEIWGPYLRRNGKSFTTLPLEPEPKRHGITIGNDVWIGARVYIRGGVQVGDGAIIGANAVVIRDVPPFAVVAGNPSRVIKMRFADPVIEALMELRWWDYCFSAFDGIDLRDPPGAIDRIRALIDGGLPRYAPAPYRVCELPLVERITPG